MPKILLVEDNEMNGDMLSRRLARRGFDVSIATDGRAGIQQALSDRPDLVLMDMSLPVLDGWETTRRMRADPALARIPIIALTAHVLSDDRERCLQAGCDEYDSKPIEFARLLHKITKLLEKRAAG
ncbi:MAG: response regulator [Planctomycetota bacterium]|nr:response regulator [Planctomycetota bacterium]